VRAELQRSTQFGCFCRSWIFVRLQAGFGLHARAATGCPRMFQQTGGWNRRRLRLRCNRAECARTCYCSRRISAQERGLPAAAFHAFYRRQGRQQQQQQQQPQQLLLLSYKAAAIWQPHWCAEQNGGSRSSCGLPSLLRLAHQSGLLCLICCCSPSASRSEKL